MPVLDVYRNWYKLLETSNHGESFDIGRCILNNSLFWSHYIFILYFVLELIFEIYFWGHTHAYIVSIILSKIWKFALKKNVHTCMYVVIKRITSHVQFNVLEWNSDKDGISNDTSDRDVFVLLLFFIFFFAFNCSRRHPFTEQMTFRHAFCIHRTYFRFPYTFSPKWQ